MVEKRELSGTFEDRISVSKAGAGILTCLMYCIGIPILCYSISPVFGVLSYVTYLIAIILFGKNALTSIKGKSVWKVVKYTILAIVLIMVNQIVVSGIMEPAILQIFDITRFHSSNTASLTEQIQNQSIVRTVWLAVGYTVIGPAVEELLYRVCMFRVIYQKNKFLGHLLTAFLFGLQHVFVAAFYGGHPQEFFLIGSYMIFSLIMTKLYVKTKTPIPGMIAHMITNAIGVCYMLR